MREILWKTIGASITFSTKWEEGFCNLAFEYVGKNIIVSITLQDHPVKMDLYETEFWIDGDQKVKWQVPFSAYGKSRTNLHCQSFRRWMQFLIFLFHKLCISALHSHYLSFKDIFPLFYYLRFSIRVNYKHQSPQASSVNMLNVSFTYFWFSLC